MKIVTKLIRILKPSEALSWQYIEKFTKRNGIDPVRWAIVDVEENHLLISASGSEITEFDLV